jgi:DNA transformation protein
MSGMALKKINPFVKSVLKKLKPHGPITARAMFGGYGIYFGDIIFALIADNRLYFRTDDLNRGDYNSEPFVYQGMAKPVVMPYMGLPDKILDNPRELPSWIKKAVDASLRNKKKK